MSGNSMTITLNGKEIKLIGTAHVSKESIEEVKNIINEEKPDMAIKDFSEAIRLRANYAVAWHNRANAWYSKGELDKALADINRSLAINPSFAGAYASRANILRLLGNSESAAADFEEAQRLK
jgi:Uncharacterized homolog of PrgY (pheromone shutdown protein)